MSNPVPPERLPDDSRGEIYAHEAFGLIQMTTPHGGNGVLFGSDLRHTECVRITVTRAQQRRDLSNDWMTADDTVVVLELSNAQFAQFITSNGNGDGTPCTLRYAPAPGTPTPEMAEIERIESAQDTFRREIRAAATKRLEAIQAEIDRLGVMVETGKLPKTELREVHKELTRHAQQLGGSIGFVVEQAEEALAKATSHAKIEVEAYIDNVARRVGLETAAKLGLSTPPQSGQHSDSARLPKAWRDD